MTAMGVAMAMAVNTPGMPFASSSTLVTAPRSPAMMPSGRPKFRPQPDCTMGTMASTRTPFMPKRTRVSLKAASTGTPTNGETMKRMTRKTAIRILGQPASSMNFLMRFMRLPPP